MNRNVIVLLFFFTGLALLFWSNESKRQRANAVAFESSLVPKGPNRSRTQNPAPEPVTTGADATRLRTELAQKQQALDSANEALEILRQNHNRLLNQKVQEEQQMSFNDPARTAANQNERSQLTSLLEEYRLAEVEMNEAAAWALREQSNTATLDRDQIEQSIASLQTDLDQAQNLIQYWQSMPPLILPEQQVEYQSLLELRAELIQQITNLRTQRIEVSANVLARSRALYRAVQENKLDLLENELAVRERLDEIRNEAAAIQQSQIQLRSSSKSLLQQIQDSQQKLQEQENVIKELEASMANLRKSSSLEQLPELLSP